jgi:hypothetical protein
MSYVTVLYRHCTAKISIQSISIDSNVGVIDCYIALLMVISQDGHVRHARRCQNEESESARLPTFSRHVISET